MAALRVIAAAASALIVAAATTYKLDTTWPQPLPAAFSNISQLTAIAPARNASGATEVLVMQRGKAAPYVLVLDEAGNFVRAWSDAGIVSGHGIFAWTDVPSTVWLADILDGSVKQFSEEGELLRTAGTAGKPGTGTNPLQFSAPADVAVSMDGKLVFVSDGDGGSANRVVALHASNLSAAWVVGGLGTAPGQFNSPHSLAYDAQTGWLWVADRGNTRLQVLVAATGEYVGEYTAADGCFGPGTAGAGGIPWGVRVDPTRGTILVPDGINGMLYVLARPDGSTPLAPCKLVQSFDIGVAPKPHLVGLDLETGAVYLAGVGSVPTAQRYLPVA